MFCLTAISVGSGCETDTAGDPRSTLQESRVDAVQRVTAAETLWERAQRGEEPVASARALLKEALWDRDAPPDLRLRAVQLLLSDDRAKAEQENAQLARLLLPTEPDRRVVAELCRAAAERGWTEASDAIVRRFADDDAATPDRQRIEAIALRELHPSQSLEDILFAEFLSDDAPPGLSGALDWPGRVRADAWTVLSRLDPSGEARRSLLQSADAAQAGPDVAQTLEALRAASEELRVLPRTAGEFEWVRSLRDGTDANERWWDQTAGAVSRAQSRFNGALRLRHLEPIRWASEHRPRWIEASRAELLSMLRSRLAGRTHHARWAEGEISRSASDERLEDWQHQMRWPDVLAMLVVDEAVRHPEVVRSFRAYAVADREDTGTEYGGVLEAQQDGDGFRAVLFPPRQRDRVGDQSFIASGDMLAASDRALAHFHMQVRRANNAEFAGPSPEDLLYAKRSGRTGVVITSISRGKMNIDAYQPDGVIIDLGEIRTGG